MKKDEFIKKLRRYLMTSGFSWKGQQAFVEFLVDYLTRLDLTHFERYDFSHLNNHIPQIVVDAFYELRTGNADWILVHRQNYEQDVEHPVPNIMDVGASNPLHQCSAVQTTLGYVLRDALSDDHISHQIDAYCNAQIHVIQQYFDRFLREVYRKGLFQIIENSKVKGMCGKFGNTELWSFSMAGRLTFTFARKEADEEIWASFIVEDGDPTGYTGGQGSCNTNFVQTLELLSDVISNWPTLSDEQLKSYKDNNKVTLDVVAEMKTADRAETKIKRPKRSATN
jgi:hypothetical protein